MTTNIPPTEAKTLPEHPHTGHGQPTGGGKPKKRGFIWAIFLIIVLGVGGYAVYNAGKPQSTGAQKTAKSATSRTAFGPQPVVVAEAKRASVPVYLNGLGNVTAFYSVLVKSRVDGQLMSVNFKEGDFVQKDQVLIEIDPRPYQVQLALAEGTLARDQALLDNARLDLERYRNLMAQDAIPKQQLDTQTALVAQYQGSIKQDTANVDSAKLQLTYSKVVAPISGRVGLRLVDPGNIVHANDANGMVLITQLDPISVLFTIPEDSLPQVVEKIRSGMKLPVEAFSRDNSRKIASGVVQTLDNQIDSTTGTSKLKAVFDNKDDKLFPNQFVNIRLLANTLTDQLVVPAVAVQTGQQGTFVYVVDADSKVHIRPVQIRQQSEETADIASGIQDGDQVVVDGTDRLSDGLTVRVRKPGELEQINADLAKGGGKRSGKGGKNAKSGGTEGGAAEQKGAGGAGSGGAASSGGASSGGASSGGEGAAGKQAGGEAKGEGRAGGHRKGGGKTQ